MVATELFEKCGVLADIWTNYRKDDNLIDFVDYNLLGLATAYLVYNNLVEPKDEAIEIINDTFDFLCASLGVEDIEEIEF